MEREQRDIHGTTDEERERIVEIVIQARDGLITKEEMADKIEALFPVHFGNDNDLGM